MPFPPYSQGPCPTRSPAVGCPWILSQTLGLTGAHSISEIFSVPLLRFTIHCLKPLLLLSEVNEIF